MSRIEMKKNHTDLESLFSASLVASLYLYVKDNALDMRGKFVKLHRNGTLKKDILQVVEGHSVFVTLLDKEEIFEKSINLFVDAFVNGKLSEAKVIETIKRDYNDVDDKDHEMFWEVIFSVTITDNVISAKEKEVHTQLVAHLGLNPEILEKFYSENELLIDNSTKKKTKKSSKSIMIAIIAIASVLLLIGIFMFLGSSPDENPETTRSPITPTNNQETTSQPSSGSSYPPPKVVAPQAKQKYALLYTRPQLDLGLETIKKDLNTMYGISSGYRPWFLGSLFMDLTDLANIRPLSIKEMSFPVSEIWKEGSSDGHSRFIKKEEILSIMTRLLNSQSKKPEQKVYSGKYLAKAREIDWSNPDLAANLLTQIYDDIGNDIDRGKFIMTTESRSELIELISLAQIIPVIYWYNGMYTFVETDNVEFCQSKAFYKTIPQRYTENLTLKKIQELENYSGILENILGATSEYMRGNINNYLIEKEIVVHPDEEIQGLQQQVKEIEDKHSTTGDFVKKNWSKVISPFLPESKKAVEEIERDEARVQALKSEISGIVTDDNISIRDYEVITLLSFFEFICQKTLFKVINPSSYFSVSRPFNMIIDYKPLVDKYFKLKKLLDRSEKLTGFLLNKSQDSSSARLLTTVFQSNKIINQMSLLLSRVIFFDIPLACDSLYTYMELENCCGAFGDDEDRMIRVVQQFSTLNPIRVNFCVTSYTNEMMQSIYKFVKGELSDEQYQELKQRAQTQPAWLEEPKL